MLLKRNFRYLDGENGGGGGGASDPSPGKTYDEAYVQGLRAEAAKYRTNHKAVADELEALKIAHATIANENTKLKGQIQEISLRSQAIDMLVAAGTTKPDAVFKLIRDQLKPDDQGNIDSKELQKVVEEATKEYPELFGTRPTPKQIDADKGNNSPAPGNSINDLIRRAAGR